MKALIPRRGRAGGGRYPLRYRANKATTALKVWTISLVTDERAEERSGWVGVVNALDVEAGGADEDTINWGESGGVSCADVVLELVDVPAVVRLGTVEDYDSSCRYRLNIAICISLCVVAS
jgi:hypothetical protein